MLGKIVSGAQTGVDRAALDAAQACGFNAGGWCPAGRKAEDGKIPAHYPVTELANAGYLERTERNVIDSDATLIIYFHALSGGTRQTHRFCIRHNKPHLLIDAETESTEQAANRAFAFIEEQRIGTLNVAGPRASGEIRGYDYSKELIRQILTSSSTAVRSI